jgi:hypothetical protein
MESAILAPSISLELTPQRGRRPGEAVCRWCLSHETQVSAMRVALEHIAALDTVMETLALI